MKISVDPSLAMVRCWYPLTGLYVRICDMCICALWSNQLFVCVFVMILRFDYLCIKWFIICFGKPYWISSSEIKILILCLILLCCCGGQSIPYVQITLEKAGPNIQSLMYRLHKNGPCLISSPRIK